MDAQSGLQLCCSQTPGDRFSLSLRPNYEIMVLTAYTQKFPLNAHAGIYSRASLQILVLSLYLILLCEQRRLWLCVKIEKNTIVLQIFGKCYEMMLFNIVLMVKL